MQQPAESNVVATICKYAKDIYKEDGTINAETERHLHHIWKQTSVDCSYGRYNAMYLLAKEGTPRAIRALDYLRKNWNANVNWAVMGAAAAGNYNLIKKLLADGAMVNYAMVGAGQRGDRELVKWLKERGGDVFWAVSGAAGSSNQALYDELNKEAEAINKKINPTRQPFLERAPSGGILLGAAMVDNPTLRRQLLDSEASSGLLIQAIIAAAQENKEEQFEELLATPLPQELGKKTDYLVKGAFAGHQDGLISKYLKRKDQLLWAAEGAGYGGHLDLIDYLLSKVPAKRKEILNFAADHAARKGDIRVIVMLQAYAGTSKPQFDLDEDYILGAAEEGQIAVLNLCSRHIDKVLERKPQFRSEIIKALTKQGFINGNEENVLRVASFVNDPKLRELFIAEACKLNNKLEPKYLERKASLLNKFMKDYDLNYNQALAWNSPEFRTWLVQKETTRYLPDEVVQHIASYVVPLTDAEAQDLTHKLSHASQEYTAALRSNAAFKFSEQPAEKSRDEPDVPAQKERGPEPGK